MYRPGKHFESLVETIETFLSPGARVQANATVTDKITGKQREIDLAIWHRGSHGELLYMVECKDLKRPVDVTTIEQIHAKGTSVHAARVAVASTSGFSRSARMKADHLGIDLLELSDGPPLWEGNFGLLGIEVPVLEGQIEGLIYIRSDGVAATQPFESNTQLVLGQSHADSQTIETMLVRALDRRYFSPYVPNFETEVSWALPVDEWHKMEPLVRVLPLIESLFKTRINAIWLDPENLQDSPRLMPISRPDASLKIIRAKSPARVPNASVTIHSLNGIKLRFGQDEEVDSHLVVFILRVFMKKVTIPLKALSYSRLGGSGDVVPVFITEPFYFGGAEVEVRNIASLPGPDGQRTLYSQIKGTTEALWEDASRSEWPTTVREPADSGGHRGD